MPASYLGLLVLAGLTFIFAVAVLTLSGILSPKTRRTSLPYESGVAEPVAAPGRQRLGGAPFTWITTRLKLSDAPLMFSIGKCTARDTVLAPVDGSSVRTSKPPGIP